ncbi:MAG: UvrD-helicase domain-containing protein [Planctomycetaceae bacterium]
MAHSRKQQTETQPPTQHAATRLTSEQQLALGLRGVSLALSAGAGCGKTFILTERFLADLEKGDNPQSLFYRVAITFTERAAREMRDRIRKAALKRMMECNAEQAEFWQTILHGLDTARISTIHSFCATLLRSHAVETGLDPHFGLLDQQTTGTFLYKAVSHTLHGLLIDQEPQADDLVLHYGLERTMRILSSLVSQRHRGDWKSFSELTPETLQQRWIKAYHERFIPELILQFQRSSIIEECLQLLREHEPSHPVMQGRRLWLLENLTKASAVDDPVTFLQQIPDHAKVLGGGTAKAWPDVEVYEMVKYAFDKIRGESKKLLEKVDINETDSHTSARLALAAVRLAEQADREYTRMKTQHGLLDFDDLLMKTRDLLADHRDVRERIQQGIELLMVDEFQDTDPLQANIVRMLCGDGIWEGKLFLVGDTKQSIYRFRKADPRVFEKFRQEVKPAGNLPLSTNFRSQPDILNFVNLVFQPVMRDYKPLEPFSPEQLSPPPTVEFLFAHPELQESPDDNPARDSETDHSPDDDDPDDKNVRRCRKREADWIARRIRSLLDDPTKRVRYRNPETGAVELRPVRPGDVVLLFRGLTNVAVYEEALRDAGLEYYLVGGRAFYAQQEIYDVVNLLQYLDDTADTVSLVGALRSPFFNISDDSLLILAKQPGSWNAFLTRPVSDELSVEQLRYVQRAQEVLNQLHADKDRFTLVELMNSAIELTGYDASLLHEFLGKRKLANLRKLIGLARTFDQSGLFSLKDFVQRLRTAVEDETDEEFAALHAEQTQIIRLMTIHQSKGLEFPVVFVAQMQWVPRGGHSDVYFHPEFGPLLPPRTEIVELSRSIAHHMHQHFEKTEDEAELIRLLYVAMTRAADHLVLSAGLPGMARGENKLSPWLTLLKQRFDLSTGLPVFDPLLGSMHRDGAGLSASGSTNFPDIPQIKVHLQMPQALMPEMEEIRLVRAKHFAAEVANAAPSPLPEFFGEVAAIATTPSAYSVSEIESACQQCHVEGDTATLDLIPDDEVQRMYPAEAAETHPATQRLASGNIPGESADERLISPTDLGTSLHLALEHLVLQHRQELGHDLSRIFATQIPQPSADIVQAVTRRLGVLHSSPDWNDLLNARVCWRELDFLLSWPMSQESPLNHRDLIRGKIDCLYQSADGSWVVRDYKTIPWNVVPAADAWKPYQIQLGLYALAVEQMFGEMPDRVELVFLGRHIYRQSFSPNAKTLSPLKRQIEQGLERLRNSH